MAYSADRKPLELTALTSLATDDTFVVGDTSDTSEVAKAITKADLITDLASSFAPALGADDNYVTDAEKVVIGNTSGTNTGDNAVNTLYSGLVTNATHTGEVTGSGVLTLDKTAVSNKTDTVITASDVILFSDASDSGNLKSDTVQGILDLMPGGGDVTKVGTPVNNQIGVWTGDGTIEGDTALTFDTSTDVLSTGGIAVSSATQDTIAAFTTASKTITSLAVGTYPTLTELAYVKGVTSSIQTQINALSGGGITWSEVTGTSQAGAINSGYILNNAGLVTVTLPDTAAVGSVIKLVGKGAGGWALAQNASENINFGNITTTTGVGGSLASSHRYDCVELVCTVANTTWTVTSSQGNITYV